MDAQCRQNAGGLFSRRFLSRGFLAGAENRGLALVYSTLMFVLALLFAHTHALFGAYPFALALLAAADRRVPFAFAGACVGALALGERGYVYCAAYIFLMLMRLFLSHPRAEGRVLPASEEYFEEAPPLRIAASAVGGLGLAFYQLLAGGIAADSLFFALAVSVIPPLATLLFLGYFESGTSPLALLAAENAASHFAATRTEWRLSLGVASFLFCTVLGAGTVELFGISLSCCLSVLCCLLLPQKWGLLRGTVAALLIACGTLTPVYLPAFGVMAVLSGLLQAVGLFYALAAACIGGTLAAFSLAGLPALVGFFPEATVSVALAWPLFKNLPAMGEMGAQRRRRERAEATEEARRRLPTVERMELLSGAYRSLSEIFYRLSDAAAHPTEAEYASACIAACRRLCEGCAGWDGCFEKGERNGHRALACVAEQYARGTPPPDIRIPESLLRSCGRASHLLDAMKNACAALEEEKRRADRNGVFGQNYAAMAEMLSDAARREVREGREDVALSRSLTRAFEETGAPLRHLAVFGTRHRYIVADGVRWNPEKHSEEGLRGRLEQICGCRLTPAVFEPTAEGMRMKFESMRRLSVDVHQATAARGREVSGDAFSSFEGHGDYGYALLSDGMGSGREAAVTAGICGAFLRQTLGAGTSKGAALRALNTVLCERGVECSATVDLLELDLLYGRACFVKSGAAASYVKRGERLFRIRSGTVPIGLLGALDAEKIRFDLEAGDIVVMLSDGVSQTSEDAAWLCEMLAAPCDGDLDALTDRILETARARREDGGGDDMTVALIEIKAA